MDEIMVDYLKSLEFGALQKFGEMNNWPLQFFRIQLETLNTSH